MSFTELEVVLMFALAVVVYFNQKLSARLLMHREAHAVILTTIAAVADNKASFYRKADGVIGIKPTHSQETSQ